MVLLAREGRAPVLCGRFVPKAWGWAGLVWRGVPGLATEEAWQVPVGLSWRSSEGPDTARPEFQEKRRQIECRALSILPDVESPRREVGDTQWTSFKDSPSQ